MKKIASVLCFLLITSFMVVTPNIANAEITDQERTQLLLKIQELVKLVQVLQLQLKNKIGEESVLKDDFALLNKEKII